MREPLFIADTHCDTLYALTEENRRANLDVTPERLREGGVTLQTLALWTGPDGAETPAGVDGALALLARELACLPFFTDAGVPQVFDPRDAKAGMPHVMLSIEGGEAFAADEAAVDAFCDKGVRLAALAWNHDNALCHCAKRGNGAGFTAYGRRVLRRMAKAGMAVDVSHMNERSFFDAAAAHEAPLMASHSCCRKLCDHFRNLTDEQIHLLIRTGGFIGVNFYAAFLSDDGVADVARVVDHIDHICQMGGEGVVGFGSDFDGIDLKPAGLEDAAKVPALVDTLSARGYPDAAVRAVAGQNFLRYFERVQALKG